MIIFDGNYYLYYNDVNYLHRREHIAKSNGHNKSIDAITNVNNVNFDRCDKLAEDLPLTKEYRPAWDVRVLTKLGFRDIRALTLDTEDYVCETAFGHIHTPMAFGLCARLPYSNVIINLSEDVDELEQVQHIIDKAVDDVSGTWKILSNRDCVRLLLTLYTVNITASQAAEILDCSYSLAAHDLKLLTICGLVVSEKIDGEKVYKLKNRKIVTDIFGLTAQVRNSHDSGKERM